MKSNLRVVTIATFGLLLLGACSSNQPTTTPNSPPTTASESPSAAAPTPTASPNSTTSKTDSHGGRGGQIIETGTYHLELVTFKEADGTHIDFFLERGDAHEPIPDAKVTAQVQLPDGSQKALEMKYDANGKHYAATLPSTAPGDYRVVILTDIQGEKINGRFRFKQ